MNNIVKYLLAGIGAFILGVGGVYLIKSLGSSDKAPEPAPTRPVTETRSYVTDTMPDTKEETPSAVEPLPAATREETDVREVVSTKVEKDAPAIPELAIDKSEVKVRLESNGTTYSVTGLKAINASSAGARFVLSDSEHHVFRSATGEFHSVVGNTKGVYAVTAYDNATGAKSKYLTISGFKSMDQSGSAPAATGSGKVEPLSASELASIFNTGNSENLESVRDRIVSKNCHVTCNITTVTTMSDVFRTVNIERKKATVSDVKYDASGRVKSMTVNLQ